MAINVNIKGGTVQLSGNPIEIECSGGVAPAGSTGYVILLRVISTDENLFGAPFEDAKAIDNEGKATFKIQAYADQPIRKYFQYPITSVYAEYDAQLFHIQVQAGEYWLDADGVSHEVWGDVNPTVVSVLKGGTSPRQLTAMKNGNTSFFELYVQGNQWLTNRPWGDEIHPLQHVKLWFIVDQQKTAILTIRTTFQDFSQSTFQSEEIVLNPEKLYEFNCNPADHGESLENDGSKAYFIDVWLDFGGTTSSSYRFHFDDRPIEWPVFLFFANSLGGIDDVYFSGSSKDDFEVEGENGEYPYQSDDTIYDGTIRVSERVGQNKFVFNSGYKGPTVVHFYRDLVLSRQCWYLYYNINHNPVFVIPITIDPGSFRVVDKEKDFLAIEIKASEAVRSPFNFDNRQF